MGGWTSQELGARSVNLDRRRVPVRSSDRRPGPYPYYGASGVVDHVDGFLFDGLHLLVAEDGENLRSRKTPIAFLADGQFWVNNHAHILAANESNDTRYLAYALGAVDVSGYITGSAQPKLTQAALASIPIFAPGPNEQRGIAATLGALDDKIESNRRASRLALELADASYTKACINGRAAPLAAVAEFHNRRRVPLSSLDREQRAGPYPYYGATGIFGHVDDYLFDEVLVLVGEDGSVVNEDGTPVTQYIWGKTWINNHAHPLTGSAIPSELLLLALRHSDVRPIVTGAVQPKISMGNLKQLELWLPPDEMVAALALQLDDLFGLFRHLHAETAMLSQLRDTLLPELLSGRIRVPEARDVVDAL